MKRNNARSEFLGFIKSFVGEVGENGSPSLSIPPWMKKVPRRNISIVYHEVLIILPKKEKKDSLPNSFVMIVELWFIS